MSRTGFTKGPWSAEVGDHTHRYVLVKDADDQTVYYKYGSGSSADADRDEANAYLIAASPTMHEALEAFPIRNGEDLEAFEADAYGWWVKFCKPALSLARGEDRGTGG